MGTNFTAITVATIGLIGTLGAAWLYNHKDATALHTLPVTPETSVIQVDQTPLPQPIDRWLPPPADTPLPQSTDTPQPQPSEITVDATNQEGSGYTFDGEEEAIIKFYAFAGEWVAIPELLYEKYNIPPGPVDGDGYVGFEPNRPQMPCPYNNLGALVVMAEDGTCIGSGTEGQVTLQPGQTIFFLINDIKDGYDDNSGSITVQLLKVQ